MSKADEHRQALGFLTVAGMDALGDDGVRVLDPFSTLISECVRIGNGTVVYPTAILRADSSSVIEVADRCVFYPGCVIEAVDGGRIAIDERCELGPGGVQLRADGKSSQISLGPEVRLTAGCDLTGFCQLGRGAQILGAISARSVRLGGGRGGRRWPVADERGAVLKGMGVADGVILAQGEVKSRRPSFAEAPVERQAAYHPPTE